MTVDDDLVDRILEGTASDEDNGEFQAWLEVPENLQRFALRAELHANLRRSLQRGRIKKDALEASTDSVIDGLASSQEQHPSPMVRSRQMLALTATGLVTAACILIAFMWPKGNTDSVLADDFTATVVTNVNGLLSKNGSRWEEMRIPVGDYELQRGLLNLQFAGGVMVYVEAPARFDVVNDKRVVLHSGRLSARVPPEGIGFSVETPEAEVVDFGTEFSVDVEDGGSEVHVFEGLVHVHPESDRPEEHVETVQLEASQALRISGRSSVAVDIELDADRFIRDFDEPRLGYARRIKRLSPLAYYRMAIRDQGLASAPTDHSGVVLTGEGKRPPHARGFFAGGSLRVRAGSIGRGGRVDTPPKFATGQFSLAVFLYLEEDVSGAIVATNRADEAGNFELSLDASGKVRGQIRNRSKEWVSIVGKSTLPRRSWRHVVLTADGETLRLYEDGSLVSSTKCSAVAEADAKPMWFGTDSTGTMLWNGRIDELALFGHPINATEVRALYEAALEQVAFTQDKPSQ